MLDNLYIRIHKNFVVMKFTTGDLRRLEMNTICYKEVISLKCQIFDQQNQLKRT